MANSRCSAVPAEMASDVVVSSDVMVTTAVVVDTSARAESGRSQPQRRQQQPRHPGETSGGSAVVIVTGGGVKVIVLRESSAALLLTGRRLGQRGPAAERAELDAGGHDDYSGQTVSRPPAFSGASCTPPVRSPAIKMPVLVRSLQTVSFVKFRHSSSPLK